MITALIRALRPKQWTKNAVVMAAYFFAFGDPTQGVRSIAAAAAVKAAIAVAVFCMLSSAVYLMNDLLDVNADRAHPVKRLRPIASGALPAKAAWIAFAVLLSAGFAVSVALLPIEFTRIAAGYIALQVAYSLWLKHLPLLDVFIIAVGFVLRAIAGAEALLVRISPWLLLCTFLLALFLALCKRRHEMGVETIDPAGASHRAALAGYDSRLLDQLIAITSAATIVCYAIYTLCGETVERFGTHRLGFTIPFVVFGVFRYLDLAYRHHEGGRPEQILLTDKVLLADIILYVLSVMSILAL